MFCRMDRVLRMGISLPNAQRTAAELPGWSASTECAPETKGPRVPFVSDVSLPVPTRSEKPSDELQAGIEQ
jgi:hypothetical protein